MRYQVPQFTDVEDKIIGPFTFKQFVYLAGSAGLCVVLYYIIPWGLLAVVLMVPVGAFGAALAFYKVNNRPFIRVVEAFAKYVSTQKLYIWKHQIKKLTPEELTKKETDNLLPHLSDSKLKDITWNLDVKK